MAGTLAVAGLVGGGITIGATFDDPGPVPSTTTPPEAAPNVAVAERGNEPIVDVARAVGPSVVLVTTGSGQGSGIVYRSDGLIVTNAHVVGTARRVVVTTAAGDRLEGVVLGTDAVHDVAVVEVDPDEPLVAAPFASSSEVAPGQTAVAIGSPFGLTQTVTAGIISAVGRLFPAASSPAVDRVVEMLQTDAPINPGNSGGPLADLDGRVIGMNTSIRTDGSSGGNVGVGFALPSDSVRIIADRIIAGEPLDFGLLGVTVDDPPDGVGALITGVTPDGGAEAAGLLIGDVVVAVDGSPIVGRGELVAQVQLRGSGTVVELAVDRDGQRLTVSATLTAG